MNNPVIFWDIDGTILSGSLERCFLKYLRRHHHTSIWRIAVNAVPLFFRLPPPKWLQYKLAYLRGKTVSEVGSLVKSCWETAARPSLFAGSVEAIRQLRSAGARQVLLSGTPRPLAEPLADFLGISDIIVAEPEIRNDSYTGGLTAPHPKGVRKVIQADAWLKDKGYEWDQTVVVADCWLDLRLLERARVPIVVRPDKQLREYSRQMGWPIIDDVDDPHVLTASVATLRQ